MAANSAAAPSRNLRDFIKIAPQTHVFFGRTMSQARRQHNRAKRLKQV
jgi:hypothetical protein